MTCSPACLVTEFTNHHVMQLDELCTLHTINGFLCYAHADEIHYQAPRFNGIIANLADPDAP